VAVAILAGLTALGISTAGTVLAAVGAILAAYGLYSLMEQIEGIARNWNDCPDERDYLIGQLLGETLGGLLGGAAGKAAAKAARNPNIRKRVKDFWQDETGGGPNPFDNGGQKPPVRTEPENLREQLTMEEAKAGAGTEVMRGTKCGDPKFQDPGWTKMQHVHRNPDGTNTTVHYMKNTITGETTQFKYKN
jgi:hypothetical protein